MSDYLGRLFSLDGRVAVVTGGSSGIGRAIAGALAHAGARVVVVARGAERLAETVNELRAAGRSAVAVSVDVADRDALGPAAETMAGEFGEPDILVNCAAVNRRPPMDELTLADWDQTIAANLTAPFLLGQRFGPAMARRGWGRIINIASQQAVRAFGHSGAYGASKGGLVSLTRSQSEAWSRRGVCCNAVSPGFVVTPMTAAVAGDRERSAALVARTMTGRHGLASDFEGIAVFLASPASDYITGQLIFVDGGFSAS